MSNHQSITIIDFGSQFTQLIARRVRELNVYCEVISWKKLDYQPHTSVAGIILSGGPASVNDENAPSIPPCVLESGLPILGICYGMQIMAQTWGGKVANTGHREFGYARIQHEPSKLWNGIGDEQDVWMSHGDQVLGLPAGLRGIGHTLQCQFAAFEHESKPYWGLQFHPEVTHTPQGKKILENFVIDICGCVPSWTMKNFMMRSIDEIRQTVGHEHIVLGLSGGVDSSVVAALIHRAVPDQLHCVFVDHGLLRKNEAVDVCQAFANIGMHIEPLDASQIFLNALNKVSDAEQKRKIIGAEFVHCFEREAKKLNAQWLAQGTIYPDVIESSGASSSSQVIKSHHNVGGLPEKLQLKLLEPLRHLFKDEVRLLGEELGLPADMVYRHPFPGPGLAIRIIGPVHEEALRCVRESDAIFLEELRNYRHENGGSYYHCLSQAFTVFLPVKSVGVMGDARTHEYTICLRAVKTDDFMTAHWSDLPYELLSKISHRITNEVRGINRVVYDISNKPPATIEWE